MICSTLFLLQDAGSLSMLPTPMNQDEFLRLSTSRNKSPLEASLEVALTDRLPQYPPLREYKFHPKRLWRLDFAWLDHMLAVEIQGGTFTGGRHTRGSALHDEYTKLNAAVAMGWRVLMFDTVHLKDVWQCVDTIAAAIARC